MHAAGHLRPLGGKVPGAQRPHLDQQRRVHPHDVGEAQGVRQIFQRSIDAGDIYKKNYTAWYLTREERFVTDTEAQEWDFKDPGSGKPLTKMSEESYFFRMSKYQSRLVEHIQQHPEFIQLPNFRTQMLRRLEDDLRDLCVSRKKLAGHPAAQRPRARDVRLVRRAHQLPQRRRPPRRPREVECPGCGRAPRHRQGHSLVPHRDLAVHPHVLRDSLPRTVFSHGFVNDRNGQKMSKSIGNVVDPNAMLDKYDKDAFRWFLLCTCVFGDLPFQEEGLVSIANADLADTLGNLVCRAVVLTQKNCDGVVPDCAIEFDGLSVAALRCAARGSCALRLPGPLRGGHRRRQVGEPYLMGAALKFKGDENAERRRVICRSVCEALYVAAHFLFPAIPCPRRASSRRSVRPWARSRR